MSFDPDNLAADFLARFKGRVAAALGAAGAIGFVLGAVIF